MRLSIEETKARYRALQDGKAALWRSQRLGMHTPGFEYTDAGWQFRSEGLLVTNNGKCTSVKREGQS
jgi:hypothetical protein